MSFENRQLQSLLPMMDNGDRDYIPPSRTCDHLHIDIPLDLWAYRGCLGPRFDQPTEQLLAVQDQQRRQYAAKRALQFSGKGKGRRLEHEAHYAQYTLPAPPPPPSRHNYPSPTSAPAGLSLPLPAPPYQSQSPLREYPAQPELDSQYTHGTSNEYAFSPRGHPLERLLEPPQRRRVEAFQPPYASGASIAPSLDPTNAMTVTAGPQDSSSSDISGNSASFAYSQYGSTSPDGSNLFPLQYTNEPINTDAKGVPLYAPSPMKSLNPMILHHETAFEDLSGYPPKIRQALENSIAIGARGTSPSSGAAEYELVQEYCYINGKLPGQVLGVFRDRHTANTEAAKIFLHRFWTQVMEDKQNYDVYIGDAGILTLEIKTDSPRGDHLATVFVRRKGDWAVRNDPGARGLTPF